MFECTGECLETDCGSELPLGNRIGSRANRGILAFYFLSFLVSQWNLGQTLVMYGLPFSELSLCSHSHAYLYCWDFTAHRLALDGRMGASKWNDLNRDQLHCLEFKKMIMNCLVVEELLLHVRRIIFYVQLSLPPRRAIASQTSLNRHPLTLTCSFSSLSWSLSQ